MSDVRVRIAPSPTGFFHIGNAKTAVINWLFARSKGGTFVLRLEDTDAERSKSEYADIICEALHWLGISWDEGPEFAGEPQAGEHGPYRQSERRDIHRDAAQQLLDSGKAFKCFCTKEELDAERERAQSEKRPPRYNGKCRNLSAGEIAAKGDTPFAVRFIVPEGQTVLDDLVQGTVKTENKEFDDFIIVKPNGDPVFHLAVVVDDGMMKISHVIRGDDHLSNAMRHKMLFEALGYDVPHFAHLPMVLDEHGKKYSKRLHGANLLDWRDDGYLPSTMLNYLVLLGWTPAEEGRELFTPEELVEAFDETRLGKSAGKFDLKKLQWLNGQHIRRMPVQDLCQALLPIMQNAGLDTATKDDAWLHRMTEICQEKIPTLNEIVPYTDFFFNDVTEYEAKPLKKNWRKEGVVDRMEAMIAAMENDGDWTAEALKEAFTTLSESMEKGLGQFTNPARLALTGKAVGPGLFELAELLGREEALKRMRAGIAHIQALEPQA